MADLRAARTQCMMLLHQLDAWEASDDRRPSAVDLVKLLRARLFKALSAAEGRDALRCLAEVGELAREMGAWIGTERLAWPDEADWLSNIIYPAIALLVESVGSAT